VLRLPPDDQPRDVGDQDIRVGIYEELRSLRRTIQFLAFLAAPLMLLALLHLFELITG
jgi:hypothetical protein